MSWGSRRRPGLGPVRAALAALAGLALLAPEARADVTWYRMTFEDVRSTAQGLEEAGKSFRFRREGGGAPLRVLRDPLSGSGALVLRSAPTPPAATRDRAEIQVYSGIDWDREWFASIRFRLSGLPPRLPEWQILMQCPQAGTDLPPPLSVDLEPDGRLALVARSEADAHETLWSAPLPRDRWMSLVLGFRMGEHGRARLWLDGERMVDRRMALGWRGRGERRCVLKAGIYRAPSPHPFELRLDDVTLADSYAAALPLPPAAPPAPVGRELLLRLLQRTVEALAAP